jgi:hypothetical protein
MKWKQRASLGGILASVTLLGACVQPIEVTQAPIKADYKPGFSVDRVAGESAVTVRSFTGAEKERKEFSGAACVLESDEIRASFTTPAEIIVPKFRQRKEFASRGRPTSARVVCKAAGSTGIASFDATDKQVQTATNAGVGGAILTAVVSGAIADSTPWKYPGIMSVTVQGVE